MKAIKQTQITNTPAPRKLQLDRTTVRTLTARDLAAVAGGCTGSVGCTGYNVSFTC